MTNGGAVACGTTFGYRGSDASTTYGERECIMNRGEKREEEEVNTQIKGVVRQRSVGEQGDDSHKRSAFQLVQ